MTGECGAVMHACVVRWCTRGRLPDASNPCGWLSRDGDRLKEHLRQKLIDCGWRDRLKEHTMGACAAFARCYSRLASRNPLWMCLPPWMCLSLAELIRSKGDTTMTVEQLTQEIIPRGRGTTLPSNGVKAATPAIASPRHTIWQGLSIPCADVHVRRDGARRNQAGAAPADTQIRRAAVVNPLTGAPDKCSPWRHYRRLLDALETRQLVPTGGLRNLQCPKVRRCCSWWRGSKPRVAVCANVLGCRIHACVDDSRGMTASSACV